MTIRSRYRPSFDIGTRAVAMPKEIRFLPPTTITRAAPALWIMASTALEEFARISSRISMIPVETHYVVPLMRTQMKTYVA